MPQTNNWITSTASKPTVPIMVSIIVHERKVSAMLNPKYSLNIQKPVSLTWEHIRLPAPTESTIKAGETCMETINGCTIPAAVSPATVAEPTDILITVATSQPKNKGDKEEC